MNGIAVVIDHRGQHLWQQPGLYFIHAHFNFSRKRYVGCALQHAKLAITSVIVSIANENLLVEFGLAQCIPAVARRQRHKHAEPRLPRRARPLDHICKQRLCLRETPHLGGLLDIRRDELLSREPAIAHARIPTCYPTGSKVIQPVIRCHRITGIDGRRRIAIVHSLQKRQLGRAHIRIKVAHPVAQRDKRTRRELVGA